MKWVMIMQKLAGLTAEEDLHETTKESMKKDCHG